MANIPVLGIVGFSNSGKTTLIEKLLPELRSHGLRVAVIKHDAHPTVFDQPGKDSRRFTQAGAEITAVTSGTQTMWIENRPLSFEELAARIEDADLILAEGFKAAAWPKLLVCGGKEGETLAVPLSACAGLVTDGPRIFHIPQWKRNDIKSIAAFILGGEWNDERGAHV